MLRVEDERIRLRESTHACYRLFVPRLSLKYRRQLENFRAVRKETKGCSELTWEAIIEDARSRGDCTNLCPEDGG